MTQVKVFITSQSMNGYLGDNAYMHDNIEDAKNDLIEQIDNHMDYLHEMVGTDYGVTQKEYDENQDTLDKLKACDINEFVDSGVTVYIENHNYQICVDHATQDEIDECNDQ